MSLRKLLDWFILELKNSWKLICCYVFAILCVVHATRINVHCTNSYSSDLNLDLDSSLGPTWGIMRVPEPVPQVWEEGKSVDVLFLVRSWMKCPDSTSTCPLHTLHNDVTDRVTSKLFTTDKNENNTNNSSDFLVDHWTQWTDDASCVIFHESVDPLSVGITRDEGTKIPPLLLFRVERPNRHHTSSVIVYVARIGSRTVCHRRVVWWLQHLLIRLLHSRIDLFD